MAHNLLPNVEFLVVEAAAVAGQTELTTDVIDTADCDGVVFVAHLGDVTTGSVLGLAVDDSEASGSGWDDLENPLAFTAGASDADNKLLILDVYKPEKRYLRARLTRTTANAVVNGITAIKYGKRSVPVTQGATVLASGLLANPARA